MKRLVTAGALALLALASPAVADLCTIEATPAATLLLPYFEVDIDDLSGVDTFFSINNARPYSVLTHVIVWTDMSVEALDFNVYLTGYDVQTVGLGLIVRHGVLPRTAAANSVSPRGPYSGPHPGDLVYDACELVMPYTNPALDGDFLEHLQSILTGGPSSIYGGRCGGYDHGDNIARGYVTVDVTWDCTLLTPCDLGYFAISEGYIAGLEVGDLALYGAHDNALWGDWYMIDYANNFAQGDTLVHVESICADPEFANGEDSEICEGPIFIEEGDTRLPSYGPAGDPPGIVATLLYESFYGRCSTYWEALSPDPHFTYDLREPLSSTFATRFYQNAAFSGGTDLLVWRDSLFNVAFGEEDGFSCAAGPNWFPLNERQVVFFDEQENPETICTISPCPEEDILFPIEAQRVSVGDLDVAPESGWIYMNLNQVWSIPVHGPTVLSGQAWVTAVHSAEGRFSAGLSAIQLDSACDFTSVLLGEYDDYPQEETAYPWTYFFYSYTHYAP